MSTDAYLVISLIDYTGVSWRNLLNVNIPCCTSGSVVERYTTGIRFPVSDHIVSMLLTEKIHYNVFSKVNNTYTQGAKSVWREGLMELLKNECEWYQMAI